MEQDKRNEEHISSQNARERAIDKMAQDTLTTMLSPENIAKQKREEEKDSAEQKKEENHHKPQRPDLVAKQKREEAERLRLQKEEEERRRLQKEADQREERLKEQRRLEQQEKDKKHPTAGAAIRRREAEHWNDDTFDIELMRSEHPDDFEDQVNFIEQHWHPRWEEIQTNTNSLLYQKNISGDRQYLEALRNWHNAYGQDTKRSYAQTIRKVILRNLENQGKSSTAQPLLKDGNVPPPPQPAPEKKTGWGWGLFSKNNNQTKVEPPPSKPISDATATPDIISENTQELNAQAATQAAHEENSDYYSDDEI
jgi:hypothetical protein